MATLQIDSVVPLWDGCKMPIFGFGTYTLTSAAACEKAVLAALECGYRHLDTAEFYGNESMIGSILKKASVPRDQVWITTKVWDSHHGYEACKSHATKTIKSMDVGYIDLYLIHAPGHGTTVDTYKALLDLKKEGLIRSVGVSNFGVQHLEGLKKAGLPKPSVNQIELHPWRQFTDIVKYCRDEGIAVEGYSPLVKGQRHDDSRLVAIANEHKKSTCQVLIRWSLQNGYITIPMSSNPAHIKENSEVFDFELTEENMKTLSKFEDSGCTWNPTTSQWAG